MAAGDSFLPKGEGSQHSGFDSKRREFVRKAAYVTPVIITLKTAPAYAKTGSAKPPKPPKIK